MAILNPLTKITLKAGKAAADALSEINNFNWNLKIVGSSGLENKNAESA